MYCKKCGSEIDANANVCPNCGANQHENTQPANVRSNGDAPSFGYAVLGFFFPVVGLILFLVWRDEYPLRAKSCGKGALISVILSFVSGIIWGIIVVVAASAAAGGMTGMAAATALLL